MTGPAEPTLVDGVDIDAVAAAVRGCPAVDDLDGGVLGGAVTYLPGRRVPGLRITEDRIEVHVRGVWNQPIGLIADQIWQALATPAGGRPVDVFLTDIAGPDESAGSAAPAAGSGSPAVLADGTVEPWTTPNASAGPSGASTSASITPTGAETRPSS